jgi:hypothetical protein
MPACQAAGLWYTAGAFLRCLAELSELPGLEGAWQRQVWRCPQRIECTANVAALHEHVCLCRPHVYGKQVC